MITLSVTLFLDAGGDLIVEGTVREARLIATPGVRVTFVLDDQAAASRTSVAACSAGE